ncbi:MAG: DEAD/DEAH box helicase [Bacillota bacterium]
MTLTLGYALYKDIEFNAYLNELYDDILYNYSLKLFGNTKAEPKQINISHALRFADILSKSIHHNRAEKHKIWAQEIVALLNALYPNDQTIMYYIGSVLTNAGNYRGLGLHKTSFAGTDILDQSYNEYIRGLMSIPADPSLYFFKSQKKVYDNLDDQYFSYSGPTSMGKSFIMRMFIKKQIADGAKRNYAILVPTKALINEVSSKFIDDLKEMLATCDYRIVTSAGAIVLRQQHNFILVMTPERLLYLLLENQAFKLDYMFVDEAHKISSKDSRSPFYYKVIDLATKRSHDTHIVFSSPNIPNPGVYLNLIPRDNLERLSALACTYAPVSQTKYLVDLIDRSIRSYNDYNSRFLDICRFNRDVSLSELVWLIGQNAQNIVYCSSTTRTVDFAMQYAKTHTVSNPPSAELSALIRDIKNEIHGDYFLAEVLESGVAYHIGYLPSDIRMRIEELFKIGDIKTIFCTSTLVEGVNLPADNLFITSYKNGRSDMTPVDFRNLIGRVGRIEYNLYGNVILVKIDEKTKKDKFEELLKQDIPDQKLSLISELTQVQKQKIVESLLDGNIELLRYPANQSADSYALMRRFAIILLRDILSSNKTSFVLKEFANLLDESKMAQITNAFRLRSQIDDDINISVDQMDNLSAAIEKGLMYPDFNSTGIDYNTLLSFLETLSKIFKWNVYEKSTLGYITKQTQQFGKLRWYAVILAQWMTGNGLSLIMKAAIEHKQRNPDSEVEFDGQLVPYNDSKEHRNAVISSTLNAIEDVILFRISNYFLRFSLEYKRYHKLIELKNDWYEYVEYGTANLLTILLQRNGFSREASTYIKNHENIYVVNENGHYKIKIDLLSCPSKSVCKEAIEVRYNIPDLFVE